MMSMGAKSIDQVGRITLPAKLRKRKGWQENTMLEIFDGLDNTVILKLYKVSPKQICHVCESCETVVMVKGFKMCENCIRAFLEASIDTFAKKHT